MNSVERQAALEQVNQARTRSWFQRNTWFWWVIGIIIVLIILYFVFGRNKNNVNIVPRDNVIV